MVNFGLGNFQGLFCLGRSRNKAVLHSVGTQIFQHLNDPRMYHNHLVLCLPRMPIL